MILYRIQATTVSDPTTWATRWVATEEEEQSWHAKLDKSPEFGEVRSTRHEIDTGREAFALALNLADSNFTVWPGVLIRRDGKKIRA